MMDKLLNGMVELCW